MPAIRPIVRRPKVVVREGLLLADMSPHKACQHRPTSSLLGVVSADRTRLRLVPNVSVASSEADVRE